MASTESIRELAEPVLASVGLELWDVEVTRDIVRVMVERPADFVPAGPPQPGPTQLAAPDDRRPAVDLEALTAASGALSPLLDAHPEVVPDGRYQLEVSSPGVERTLRTPQQFCRYLDTEITIKTSTPVEGARRHRGRLLDASTEGIVIEPDEVPGARVEFRYDQIDRARTVLRWGPSTGRPTAGRRSSARPTPAGQVAAGRASMAHNPKDAGS